MYSTFFTIVINLINKIVRQLSINQEDLGELKGWAVDENTYDAFPDFFPSN